MAQRQFEQIDRLFNARGIAVIGASSTPGKPGNQIIKFGLEMDYKGIIYPVNPTAESILGLPCYKSIGEIPGVVDLAVIVLPADACLDAAKQIAARKQERGDVAGVVVVTAGFSEHGSDGQRREDELYEIFSSNGIRMVGPNCQGLIDTYSGVNTTFDVGKYPRGGLSFLAQSGAFSVSYLEWAHPLGLVGLNKYVSMGNMRDIDVVELLQYLEGDERTRVIALYLEGSRNARKLVQTAAEVTKKKPIVAIKSGRTELGSQAAQTHTGSIAGSDEIYDCALRQAGVIRTRSVAEFYDTCRAMAKLPLPKGKRIYVLTVVGGPGTICLDELATVPEVQLAPLSAHTKDSLRAALSPAASVERPAGYTDMTGAVNEVLHQDVLKLVLGDENVDGLIYLTTPPAFLDERKLAENIAAAYQSFPQDKRKPVLAVLGYGYSVAECRRMLEASGIPTLEYADIAAKVMINMVRYQQYRQRVTG